MKLAKKVAKNAAPCGFQREVAVYRADTCKMKCLKELIEHVVFVGDLTQFTDLEAAEAETGGFK